MYRLNPGQRNNRDHRLFSRKNKQREGRDLGGFAHLWNVKTRFTATSIHCQTDCRGDLYQHSVLEGH
jgi:hypothetical protein